MRFKKREITLNEADSLKDMLYMEELLVSAYESGRGDAERKEVALAMEGLCIQSRAEKERVEKLWEKTKAKNF